MKVVRPPYLPSNVVTKKLFRFFRIRVYEADEKLTVGYRNLVCDLTQSLLILKRDRTKSFIGPLDLYNARKIALKTMKMSKTLIM